MQVYVVHSRSTYPYSPIPDFNIEGVYTTVEAAEAAVEQAKTRPYCTVEADYSLRDLDDKAEAAEPMNITVLE